MVESFWVVPDPGQIRTPLSILREQAGALTEQTQGVLVGVVETAIIGADLNLIMEISVPALNDYRVRVLSYKQPVAMYPGRMTIRDQGYSIEDEAAFVDLLRRTLASDWTRNVLSSLLSQASET